MITLCTFIVLRLSEDAFPDAIDEFTVSALRLLIEDEKLTRKKYDMLVKKAGYLPHKYALEMMEV